MLTVNIIWGCLEATLKLTLVIVHIVAWSGLDKPIFFFFLLCVIVPGYFILNFCVQYLTQYLIFFMSFCSLGLRQSHSMHLY